MKMQGYWFTISKRCFERQFLLEDWMDEGDSQLIYLYRLKKQSKKFSHTFGGKWICILGLIEYVG